MSQGTVYEFIFRGLLAEEALDRAGRRPAHMALIEEAELAEMLAVDLLDPDFVQEARQMSVVYLAIAAFENSVRKLIRTVLLEALGEDWWEQGVPAKIRERAESRRNDESLTKWHGQRGSDPITYTDLGQLANVIQNNWIHFEPYARSAEWVKALFQVVERSRNVIMHSGWLAREDIERVGINIRDWIKQVGT